MRSHRQQIKAEVARVILAAAVFGAVHYSYHWCLTRRHKKPRAFNKGRRFRVSESQIAPGQLGSVVYHAIDLEGSKGTAIAAKKIRIYDELAAARVEKEIARLSSLSHPNIVQYLGSMRDDTHAFIFMEYMAQGSLKAIATRYGSASGQTGLDMLVLQSALKDILKGLSYLHGKGFVHGNLKAENILANGSGDVKLADFTLSASLEELSSERSYASLRWKAPEIIRHAAFSAASDVWALGCTALELAIRRPPWTGYDDREVEAMLREGCAPPLPPAGTLPDSLRDFIERCLEPSVAKRAGCCSLQWHPFLSEELGDLSPRCKGTSVVPTDRMPAEWHRIQVIGKGSFGTVHMAVDGDNRVVAVKVVDVHCDDDVAVLALRREIDTLTQLPKHENVVEYFGSVYDERQRELNVFMEFMSQGTLGKYARGKLLSEREAVSFMSQVLTGVEHLHSHSFVHRDLKGENILLQSVTGPDDGYLRAKIADFGNAKMLAYGAADTLSRGRIGTPLWMAPEVISSSNSVKYERSADIWSVGCVAVEMLNRGQTPWPRFDNLLQAVKVIGTWQGDLPPGVPSGLSEHCVSFLRCCMRSEPSERWPAKQLLQHQWISTHAFHKVATSFRAHTEPNFHVVDGEALSDLVAAGKAARSRHYMTTTLPHSLASGTLDLDPPYTPPPSLPGSTPAHTRTVDTTQSGKHREPPGDTDADVSDTGRLGERAGDPKEG
eukprot:TRINITY_DN6348_c0_g7_i1.p1 TRINITY_DN6348_c0_g7~~TRINITY_DN6348_c0_g7_i1.p1  ORF type:complete len:741 (+),score=174.63 TRINITY_DN6348_c0_g7_i1:63-2225(+)